MEPCSRLAAAAAHCRFRGRHRRCSGPCPDQQSSSALTKQRQACTSRPGPQPACAVSPSLRAASVAPGRDLSPGATYPENSRAQLSRRMLTGVRVKRLLQPARLLALTLLPSGDRCTHMVCHCSHGGGTAQRGARQRQRASGAWQARLAATGQRLGSDARAVKQVPCKPRSGADAALSQAAKGEERPHLPAARRQRWRPEAATSLVPFRGRRQRPAPPPLVDPAAPPSAPAPRPPALQASRRGRFGPARAVPGGTAQAAAWGYRVSHTLAAWVRRAGPWVPQHGGHSPSTVGGPPV